jgi:hypothetical protein
VLKTRRIEKYRSEVFCTIHVLPSVGSGSWGIGVTGSQNSNEKEISS